MAIALWRYFFRGSLLLCFAAAPCVDAAAAPPEGEAEALLVLNRLAYGPSPGDLRRVAEVGVDRWIDQQLHADRLALPGALSSRLAALESTSEDERGLIMEFRQLSAGGANQDETRKAERRRMVRDKARDAGEARLLRAVESPRQLEEVMVDFWFNHFNVFEGKGLDRVLIAAYERDSIRPHVFGRFRDLLGATAHDPAMLFYLDNWLSAAPGYRPTRARGPLGKTTGLNENYARELMELHTMGVDGGYTQSDVTELARMLTGWTIDPRRSRERSAFYFDPDRHDAGGKRWLGLDVAPRGQAEGEWALDVLAAHPSTARHIAAKLARYFVADEPPSALVERLASRFSETSGDIRAVLRTLFDSREFRSQAEHPGKFKTPYRFVVSAVRASGERVEDAHALLATLARLGMPLYGCRTPDGYATTEAAWLNQDALEKRVAFAAAFAAGRLPIGPAGESGARAPDRGDADRSAAIASGPAPRPLASDALLATLGPSISEGARAKIDRAAPGMQAALIFGSPDFMRY